VTLTESAFAKGIGMKVDLISQGLPAEFVLFGEDASRVLISCDRGNLSGIQQVAVKYGFSSEIIGETVSEQVEIKLDGRLAVSATVAELREVYEGALEAALRTEPEVVAAD
jgi:phosphoribosylformylglycinamidine (FGAM) synthase-like enzyme